VVGASQLTVRRDAESIPPRLPASLALCRRKPVCRRLVDRVGMAEAGEVDFMAALAFRLPVAVDVRAI